MSIPWNLFSTELGLVALALSLLIADFSITKNSRKVSLLSSAALAGVAILFVHHLSRWGEFGSMPEFGYTADGLAYIFKAFFLIATAATLYLFRQDSEKLERGQIEFTLLVLFALIGMMFLASASDFLVLFIALETLTVSLYVMTAYLRDRIASIEAGVKYLILGATSTAVMLFGLSFVYGTTGSTSLDEIGARITLSGVTTPFLFGVILVIAGLGFKIASFPFHAWAPDVYQGAPTPVTAFLSIGSKVAGFAVLLRFLVSAFAPAQDMLIHAFGVLAAATVIYGNLGAIPQTNIKRLLGYSSISHSGYLLMGLAAFSITGQSAVLYYLASYILAAGGVFLVVILAGRWMEAEEIRDLSGLSQISPVLAACLLLSLLSLAGIPPLAGFFAKFYILFSTVQSGLLWLTFIGAVNVVLSMYYYFRFVRVLYVDKPLTDRSVRLEWTQKTALYAVMAGILLLGIWQEPLSRLIAEVLKNSL